jgi:hypothetical protein
MEGDPTDQNQKSILNPQSLALHMMANPCLLCDFVREIFGLKVGAGLRRGLPDDLASILTIWSVGCQDRHFVNQGIGRDHSVEWIAMDGGEFSRPVDNASFQIQYRDVLYAGLFFNPHSSRARRSSSGSCIRRDAIL